MENATQALFMAAGVLIAVMIISLGVYLFSSTSSIGESYERRMSETEMLKFNNKFEPFNKISKPRTVTITKDDGSELDSTTIYYNYNSISDVVSAINLAIDVNEKNNHDSQSGVIVKVKSDDVVGDKLEFKLDTNNELQGIENDLNVLLSERSDNKLISYSYYDENEEEEFVSGKRIYQYFFDGVVKQDDTGFVHEIEFTMHNYDDEFWDSL